MRRTCAAALLSLFSSDCPQQGKSGAPRRRNPIRTDRPTRRRRRNEAATFNQGKATMPNDATATPTELHWLTIADAARLIETRRLSPVELTDALLARIEALDPQLNAFLLPTPEKAREQAKAAEREITAGGEARPPPRQ